MKGFLTTHKGMEDIASKEIKELIGAVSKQNEACITFDIKKYEDLFKLCYFSQAAIGIYYLLNEFNFKDIFKDLNKHLDKIDFSEWLNKKTEFRVKCSKNNNNISTPEMEKKFGELIINHIQEKHNYKQKVNLNNPEITIFIYLIKNKCYIGIDFACFDLSKRTYKIFIHPADIKGTIAYALVRLSDYKKNETLLDTFSSSGTIPIEAALFESSFPVNFFNKEKFAFLKFKKFKDSDFNSIFKKFDNKITKNKLKIYNIDSSMKYLNYAKKNSKIADVDKKISFSRTDLEWMDTKFKKNQIDKIVTKLPIMQKEADKAYNELFYQAEFILSKKGKIVLIGDKELIKKHSAKHKFRITSKKNIFSGKKQYEIFVLDKQ